MRETAGSMRAYFILIGALSTLRTGMEVVKSADVIEGAFAVIGLAIALGYLYLGIRFKTLIVGAPSQILTVLLIAGAFLVLSLLILLASGNGLIAAPFGGAGLLITWYLYVNARRLAREAAAAATPIVPQETV